MSYADTNHRGKTGKWVAEVKWSEDGAEHRMRRRFDNKKDADKYEAYVRAVHEEPPWVDSASPHESFAAVAEKFKAATPEWVNAGDGVTNASRLEFAISHLGRLHVKAIRGPALVKYVEAVRKHAGGDQGPANRTINYYLNAVSKVLKYAHMLDLIPGMPPMPRQKNTGRTRTALTWGEEDAICAQLEAWGKPLHAFVVRLLAATGLRAGELHKLTADQIELPEHKEYAGIQLSPEQTKTSVGRWVPLVPEAAEKLRSLIASKTLPVKCVVYDQFKLACKSAGRNPRHCIHSLRHTTVTRLGESGASTLDIAVIVGHSTGLMTQRYYHPQEKARLFEVAKKVQKRVGAETPNAEIVELKAEQNQWKGGRAV